MTSFSKKICFKNILIFVLAFALILFGGCKPENKNENGKEKEHEIFGIDLNALNPIVIWAENSVKGETAFSRDPSNISAVVKLVEKLNMEKAEQLSDEEDIKGVSFRMSTMYGDFYFGTFYGDRLWRDGEEFILDKDYTSEMERLFNLIKSESDYVGIVTRDMIDKIYPEMTYLELFALFGETKETTVLSGGNSFLYQYNNYEFYINYEKDSDFIGITSDELINEIFYRHNLTFDPIVRDRITFSYEMVYSKVISSMIDEFYRHHKDIPLERIVLDSTQWIGLSADRVTALKEIISGNYNLEVVDTTALNAYMKRELEFNGRDKATTLFINAGHYSHIREARVNVTMRAVYPGQEGNYDFDKNFVLIKKDGRWIEVD